MTKWAWMVKDSEYVYGPFETREIAIEAAHKNLQLCNTTKIMVGTVNNLVPTKYAAAVACIDDLLEMMEESAGDDTGYDDEHFQIKGNPKIAQKALERIMATWARRYISSDYWSIEDEQEVNLLPIITRVPQIKQK